MARPAQAAVPGQPPAGGPAGWPGGRARRPRPLSQRPRAGLHRQRAAAGIMGVHSKSQETSIRIYKGQTRYDQWNFVFTAANRPGGTTPGALSPAGPAGRRRGAAAWRRGSAGRNPDGRGGARPWQAEPAAAQGVAGLPPRRSARGRWPRRLIDAIALASGRPAFDNWRDAVQSNGDFRRDSCRDRVEDRIVHTRPDRAIRSLSRVGCTRLVSSTT